MIVLTLIGCKNTERLIMIKNEFIKTKDKLKLLLNLVAIE